MCALPREGKVTLLTSGPRGMELACPLRCLAPQALSHRVNQGLIARVALARTGLGGDLGLGGQTNAVAGNAQLFGRREFEECAL
jgi:hypothetical protein